MMIFSLGLMLAAFCGLVFVACLRTAEFTWPQSRWHWSGYVLLAAVLVVLLFRPEEEIEAGEDPGVYFNAALAFVQQNAFHFQDPALAMLDPADRILFRYGDPSFMITKDHSLWAQDETMEQVGAFFLTGYSLLLAVPAALGFAYGAFWISPLLAIMTGMVLGVFGRWLAGCQLGGWLAFVLYMLNPLIVWNARCIRAEWPATFLMFAGLLLLLGHVLRHKEMSGPMAFLAGLALSSAAWFHVTAVYVILPALIFGGWHSRRTGFWWCWWGGILCGFALLFAQLVWISDPYWILSNLLTGWRRWGAMIGLFTGALVLMAIRHLRSSIGRNLLMSPHWLGMVLGFLYLAISLFLMRFQSEQGRIPGLPSWTAAYISLTDFATVANLLGRSVLFASLLGIPLLAGRRGERGHLGRWLFLLLAPASLTIGWSINFMFESRRMILALVPLLVLSASYLSVWVGKRAEKHLSPFSVIWSTRVAILLVSSLASALLVSAARGRMQLYRTWNYRGLYSFYQALAEELGESADFILGEYTQTTIPLERLTQLPSLPIAWGYRSEEEYRRAEQVWADLVNGHPEKRFLLVTPFSGASIPGLSLTFVGTRSLRTERLERARRRVPGGPHPWIRDLHFHRVHLSEQGVAKFPYTRVMDGGQLGLAGHANRMLARTIEMEGVILDPSDQVRLQQLLPELTDQGTIHFLIRRTGENTDRIYLSDGPEEMLVNMSHLNADWALAEFSVADREPMLRVPEAVKIAAAFAVTEDGCVQPLSLIGATVPIQVQPVNAQWLLAESRIALPGGDEPRPLYILAWSGHAEELDITLSVGCSFGAGLHDSVEVRPGWTWYGLCLPQGSRETDWFNIVVYPAWNPESPAFPEDLGIMAHIVHVH